MKTQRPWDPIEDAPTQKEVQGGTAPRPPAVSVGLLCPMCRFLQPNPTRRPPGGQWVQWAGKLGPGAWGSGARAKQDSVGVAGIWVAVVKTQVKGEASSTLGEQRDTHGLQKASVTPGGGLGPSRNCLLIRGGAAGSDTGCRQP